MRHYVSLCGALTALLAVTRILLLGVLVSAVPANPKDVFTLNQPSGSSFLVRLYGDERFHWYETKDHYTIVRRTDGVWVYAKPDVGGRLVPSGAVVGVDYPPVPRHARGAVESQAEAILEPQFPLRPITQASITDTARIVVILIEFTDTPFGEGSTGPHTSDYFEHPDSGLVSGSGEGNMRDYFEEVSYGQFSVKGVVANGMWHGSDRTKWSYSC